MQPTKIAQPLTVSLDFKSTEGCDIETVLLNHTRTRGPSVARTRDFYPSSSCLTVLLLLLFDVLLILILALLLIIFLVLLRDYLYLIP